ncbi:MAG TPA: YhjD/YihY/BrkB family envelope integrity protein [Acidimicrobiales bacterium]|nr:YhjD/YihY/BrkB family envelope integrity protein [Acidimicrobiales bacterium]
MNPLGPPLRWIDGVQRRHRVPAFVFAVVKKFGDDQGGQLAALLTYYGFLSVFPLLLVAVTVLGIVASGDSSLQHRIVHSALSQFPVIGSNLQSNIHRLKRNSPVALSIGLFAALWGSLGISQCAQYVMAQVWSVPRISRPGFLPRLGRSFGLLAVVALFVTSSSTLSGLAVVGGHTLFATRVLGVVSSAIVNTAMFVCAFRILTPKQIPWRALVAGGVVGGVAWSVLQDVGSYLVLHQLRNMSQLYGFFAGVLGLLWWMYLGAQVVVLSAETSVVRARRLWPRSLAGPPLTEADRTVLVALARSEERRPEVEVDAQARAAPGPGS